MINSFMFCSDFKSLFFFLEQFYVYNKTERGIEIIYIPYATTHVQPSPLSASFTRMRLFFLSKDKPTLTHHNHSKSIVYITVHSWWCIFCGFGQTINDVYPLLWCHTKYFHCPINHLCCVYLSFFLSPKPWEPTMFFCLHSFALFMQLDSYSIQPFQISFFYLIMCIQVSSMSINDLITHFFLALKNILSSECTTVYVTNLLLKNILITSKFQQL